MALRLAVQDKESDIELHLYNQKQPLAMSALGQQELQTRFMDSAEKPGLCPRASPNRIGKVVRDGFSTQVERTACEVH
jgi:hypothetical protein